MRLHYFSGSVQLIDIAIPPSLADLTVDWCECQFYAALLYLDNSSKLLAGSQASVVVPPAHQVLDCVVARCSMLLEAEYSLELLQRTASLFDKAIMYTPGGLTFLYSGLPAHLAVAPLRRLNHSVLWHIYDQCGPSNLHLLKLRQSLQGYNFSNSSVPYVQMVVIRNQAYIYVGDTTLSVLPCYEAISTPSGTSADLLSRGECFLRICARIHPFSTEVRSLAGFNTTFS